MSKNLLIVLCLAMAFTFGIGNVVMAETTDWIVTADKTTVVNNNNDGLNFQISLVDATGAVDTTGAASSIVYRVYAYSEQGYVFGDETTGTNSDYTPSLLGTFDGTKVAQDYGTFWVNGQTAAKEGHSAFIRTKAGLAGFNMYFKQAFTGTASITLKLEKVTAPTTSGGVDVTTLQTKTVTCTVTAGSADVTKVRIESFTVSAQDTNGASDSSMPVDVAKCQLGKISGSTVKVNLYKDSSYLTCAESSAYTGTVYLTLTGYNPSNPFMNTGTLTVSGQVSDAETVTINGVLFEFDTAAVSTLVTATAQRVDLYNDATATNKLYAAGKLADAINACTATTGTLRTGMPLNQVVRAVYSEVGGEGVVTLYSEGLATTGLTVAETGVNIAASAATLTGGTRSWVDASYNNATGTTYTFSGTLSDPSQGCTISIGDTDKDGNAVNKAGWYWMRAYVTVGSTNVYSQAGLDQILILPKEVSSATKMSLVLDKTYVHKDKDQLDPTTGTSYINSGWAFLDDADGNHCRFETTNSGSVTAQITIPTGSTGITSPTSVTIDKRAPRTSFTLASSGADITTGAMTLTLADTAVTNPITSGTASMTVADIGVSARFYTGMKTTSTLYKSVLVSNALQILKDDGDGCAQTSVEGKVALQHIGVITADKIIILAGNNFVAKAAGGATYTSGQFEQAAAASAVGYAQQALDLARAINMSTAAQTRMLYATASGDTTTVYCHDYTTTATQTAEINEAAVVKANTVDMVVAQDFIDLTTVDDVALDSTAAMTMTMEWFENYSSKGSMTATVTKDQKEVDLLFSKSFYPNGITVKTGGLLWGNYVKIKVATSATTYGECIIPMYGTDATANKRLFINGAYSCFGGGLVGSGWGITSPVGKGTPTSLQYVDGLGTQITSLAFSTVTDGSDNVYYVINGTDGVFTTVGAHNKLAVDWNGINAGTATRDWQQLTSYFRLVDANSEETYKSTSNGNTAENDDDRVAISSSRGATVTYYSDGATNSTTFCSLKQDNATALAHLYSGQPNLGYYVKLKYATTDVGSTDTVTLTPTKQGPTPLELKVTVAATKVLTSINATAARSSILKNDENIIRIEALDQYGKQIDPSSANAIYLTYDTSKGSVFNYARNSATAGCGAGAIQYTNGTFTQVYSTGTTPKPLVYMSYQAGGTTGTIQLTFEDAAKTSTKKKVVSFTISDTNVVGETTSVQYLPYLMADNTWDCYIAIQNYGSAEATNVVSTTDPKTLSLTAYDKSGVVIGSAYTSATIAANGMVLLDARTIFGATPTDGAMMVKVTMNNGYSLKIMGVMTNKSTAEKSNFMLEDAVSASGQTLVVPEAIDSTNYKTTLVVGNAGSTSETVAIAGKDSTGASYTASATLAGNGFSAQDITAWFASPSFAGKEGWAKATATNNSLIGAVIYTNATSSRNTKGLVSLSTVTRTGSLTAYIPMAVYTADFVTPQLMLANNSGSAVDVTVKAVKQDGTDFGTAKTTNVAANGYSSTAIDKTYFSSTTDMPTYFTLKITSASTEVYAMVAYMFSSNYTKSAGDFVISSPLESSSTSALNIPFFLSLTPYQNYLFVQNTGTASNSVTITAYSTNGTSAGTTTKSIGAGAMEFFVINGIAANTYGAVKVSGGAGILCTSVLAYGDGTKEIWGGFSIGN